MVAISLYKGNLHKAPDVPRQWLMPTHQLTLKQFKALLRLRSQALSRLPSPDPNLNSIPNPIPNPNPNPTDVNNSRIGNAIIGGATNAESGLIPLEEFEKKDVKEEDVGDGTGGGMPSAGGDRLVKMEVDVPDSAAVEPEHKADLQKISTVNELNAVEEGNEEERKEEERVVEIAVNPNSQTIDKGAAEIGEAIRKKEVEERLKVLKEKKHNLVQALKQLQNAEEELKRRNNTPIVTGRPAVPLQVEIPNDTGSITRVNTPRIGSDGTTGAEVEGGEPDGLANVYTDTRHLLRMSSISPSPSSDSQHKKPAYNAVPLPGRTTLGVSASPSRFAPNGQQGQASNPPTVSVSGTNYVASSPSPAASGGTSVFRENRMSSPWN